MAELLRDLRFGVRLLTKSPGFTIAAVALLAAGISSNTLIFSVVDALLLRLLPVSHPENLVRLVEAHPNNFLTWDLPYRFCEIAAAKSASLSEVLCQGESYLPLRYGNVTERVRVHLVSANFFSSLAAGAAVGRVLTAEDARTGAMNAVLSYTFWQRRFARDRAIVGRTITLEDRAYTVVGVSQQGFNGLAVESSPDVRVPASSSRNQRLTGQIFGRLRGGVPLAQASREMDSLMPDYEAEVERMYHPARGSATASTQRSSHLRLESVAHGVSVLREQFSRGLMVAMGGVALLLAMACANVAGLLLARSAGRAQEIGVRMALGAGAARIVRQLFAEGLLLAVLGGAAGAALTWLCLPAVVRALPTMRDRAAVLMAPATEIDIDGSVLAFATGITLLTAVLFALAPAWRAAHSDVVSVLRGSRTTTRSLFSRYALVSAQVALSTLILMGAALLVKTLAAMQNMDAGFDRDHVATFTIDPGLRNYRPEQARALSLKLLERTAAIPGVRATAIAAVAVMRGTGVKSTFGVAGARIPPTDFLNSSLNIVSPGYFETMGIQIVRGRDFTWFDRDARLPHPAIVNEAFVRRFFPDRDALGGQFGYAGAGGVALAENRIVGVVTDAKYRSLREPVPPTVYTVAVDGSDADFILYVRARQHPEALMEPVRKALHSLDAELPVIEAHTLRAEVEDSLWQERLLAWLAAAFGAIAALLAAIGLYGALDYAVESRRREIGVRMALGAEPARIARLVSGTTGVVIAAGAAAGMAGYAAAAEGIRHVLYEVASWDPVAIGTVLALVALIAAAAAGPAAWRAAHTDPAAALRSE